MSVGVSVEVRIFRGGRGRRGERRVCVELWAGRVSSAEALRSRCRGRYGFISRVRSALLVGREVGR